MARLFVRKLFITVLAMAASLMLVGGAYALTGTSAPDDGTATVESTPEATETPDPTETPDATETEDGGVHGGSVERVHDGCEGVDGLEGNWTHGDYVSAVGDEGGSEAKKAAAKSDCGKPDKAANPEHPDNASRSEGKAEKRQDGTHRNDSGGAPEDQGADESSD